MNLLGTFGCLYPVNIGTLILHWFNRFTYVDFQNSFWCLLVYRYFLDICMMMLSLIQLTEFEGLCWLANFNLFCILYRKIYDSDRALYAFLLQLHTFNFFPNDLCEGLDIGLPFYKQTPQILQYFYSHHVFSNEIIMEANPVLFYMYLMGIYTIIFGEWGKVSLNFLVNWGLTIYAHNCKNMPWPMVFGGNILEIQWQYFRNSIF